jgi:hypothetical protein
MLKLIVTFQNQEIVATDADIETYLGYSDSEIHGGTFKIFQGAGTEMALIQAAVQTAQHCAASVETILYSKAGIPHMVKITCSPYQIEFNCMVACLISMELGAQVATECKQDNVPLCSTFENQRYIMGSLHECYSISGSSPRSESSDSSGDDCYESGDITSSPESPCHINSKPSTGSSFFPTSSQMSLVSTNSEYKTEISAVGSDDQGHVIFPRRKAGDGIFYSSPKPIVVTLKMLQDLRDYPLVSAAEKLGVSSTAFKRACRALGIRRWSYQKLSENIRAKAMRRITNAAKRIAAQVQEAEEKVAPAETGAVAPEAVVPEAVAPEGALAFNWMISPPLAGDGDAGLDLELSGEEEVLTGAAVFEWPRYA